MIVSEQNLVYFVCMALTVHHGVKTGALQFTLDDLSHLTLNGLIQPRPEGVRTRANGSYGDAANVPICCSYMLLALFVLLNDDCILYNRLLLLRYLSLLVIVLLGPPLKYLSQHVLM